jgi:hypothetical protein
MSFPRRHHNGARRSDHDAVLQLERVESRGGEVPKCRLGKDLVRSTLLPAGRMSRLRTACALTILNRIG